LPVAEILKKFGWQYNLNFQKTALQILATPDCFQKWCHEKKMNLMDLASLLSVTKEQLTQSKYLNQFFQDISSFNFSKSIGSQVLELGIELFLIEDTFDFQNKNESESKTELKSETNKLDFQQLSQAKSAEAYLEILKKARFPMTYKQDLSIEKKWQNISWPSQAQVRFTRYGDKAGVEMRLFVSQATDLKKYLISLEKAYQMLENENLIKTEH